MRLSEQLADAMVDAGHAERVQVFSGQYVVVRTPEGVRVAEGFVDDIDAGRGLVRLRDVSSGTDRSFDVNTEKYVLWIKSNDPMGRDSAEKSVDEFAREKNQGKATGQERAGGGDER